MRLIVGILVAWVALLAVSCADRDSPLQEPTLDRIENPAISWDASLWGNPRAGTVAVDKLANLLAERTEGAWRLNLHYGEAISKARENLDGIAIGAFEVAMVCNFYHPRKNPALMVMTMPFLPLTTEAASRRVRNAVYDHPAVIREFERWDAMIYTSTFLPQYEFMGRGEPPYDLSSWRGMTVRAGGGIGAAMQLLGATPTSSTATEVYTGVQQGTMDAAAFPFTYSHVAYRIHEVSNWFTNGMAPGTADCPVVFAKSAYDALPAQYRAILAEIRPQVDAAQLQAYRDVDAVNLPMLRQTLTEVTYTPEQLAELRNSVGRGVIDAWIAENQDEFDALGLVKTVFEAANATYP